MRRYGGHVTDSWDRRCTGAYLEALLTPRLLEQKGEFIMAPGLKAFAQGTFNDARAHVADRMPSESPVLFGLHANAELGQVIAQADHTFAAILELSGVGGGAGGGSGGAAAAREGKVLQVLTELSVKLPNKRPINEIKAKVVDRGSPFTVFLLQEVERLNALLVTVRSQLAELELGLTGALNVSDAMDALSACLFANTVPPSWLAACGQSGPTGSYNRKGLVPWFSDMVQRDKHLLDWAKDPNKLPVSAAARALSRTRACSPRHAQKRALHSRTSRPPSAQLCGRAMPTPRGRWPQPSVWIAGLYNPMGYVTACLQMTARSKGLPLDSMTIVTTCMAFTHEQVCGGARATPRPAPPPCLMQPRGSDAALALGSRACLAARAAPRLFAAGDGATGGGHVLPRLLPRGRSVGRGQWLRDARLAEGAARTHARHSHPRRHVACRPKAGQRRVQLPCLHDQGARTHVPVRRAPANVRAGRHVGAGGRLHAHAGRLTG